MAIIHSHRVDPIANTHLFIVETTTPRGGRTWGQPAILRTVRVPGPLAERIANGEMRRFTGPGLEVLEEHEVDSRCQGERSRYGRTLAAMQASLATHLLHPNASVVGPLDAGQTCTGDELRTFMGNLRLQIAIQTLPEYDAKSGEFRNRLM